MRLTGRGSKNATLSFGRSTILRSSRSYRSITQYEAECCVRFFGSILRLSSRIMIRSVTMSAALNNMRCGGIHRHCRPASPAAGDRTCSPIAAAGICASRRDPRRRRRYVGAHHRRARRNADRDSDCRGRRPVFPGHSASPAWIGRTMTAILKTRSVTVQISGATLVDGIDLQVNRGEMVARQARPQRHSGDRNPARP